MDSASRPLILPFLALLLKMVKNYLYPIFFFDVFGEFISSKDGAVLAAGTAKIDGERSKTSVDIILYGAIHNPENAVEEFIHGTMLFQEVDDRLIAAREFFVRFVAPRVM